jgi:TolB-like protein
MTISRLGHYNVLDRIGAGGMGEVYRARDTKLGRTVAIKVLPDAIATDHDRRERFLREARATAALSHPNIAMLFEVGQEGDRIFLVFEYVAGRTLGAAIAGRPLAPRLALDLAIQIADALADAHTIGIVHRDIKPDNVMVTPKEKAKVLDFGLAHWTEGGLAREHAPTMAATLAGALVGTVAYMSPEQALGMPLDGRSDIFSLGVVLYEMLTGANPFAAESPTAALLNVAQKRPLLPSNVNKTLPRDLDPILMKMLAKDPHHRYDSAASLAAELRSVATVLDIRSGEAEPRNVKVAAARRRRFPWKPIVALLAILVAGAAGWRWGATDARRLWRRYVAAPLPPRIAVLPLEERAAGDRTYFADGLTEDLITRLGQVQGLTVLGRSATRELRGVSPADAAKRLNVEAVLMGSVQRQADELKVSLELVDPDDGAVVWAQQYTKTIDTVFGVQAEIADDVAQALRLKLAGDLRQRTAARQVSVRAYDLYLQAREAVARRDLKTAIDLFREALSLDGGLAEAHAGLAEAVYLQASFGGQRFDPARRREVAEAAKRAIAIDPDLAAAELAAGLAETRLAESLRHMQRAVSLDPSYAEAYHQIGDHVLGFDPSMAIDFYERAQELDRNIVASYLDLAVAYAALGNFSEAHRQIARLRESQSAPLSPALQAWAAGQAAVVTFQSGDAKAAVAQMEPRSKVDPGPNRPASALAIFVRALLAADRRADAHRTIDAYAPQGEGDCDTRAIAVGLLADAKKIGEAKAMAGGSSRGAGDERCDALLAAGLGDADAAAAALARLSKNETAMREWTMVVTGVSDHLVFKRRWYPWSRVVGKPAMADAENALEAARIDMRNVARRELSGLLR